jgi:hypothetical protein
MPIDAESLRRHYASLSDQQLLDLDRGELTETAQQCYDRELQRRDLAHHDSGGTGDASVAMDHWEESRERSVEHADEETVDDASFVACAFTDHPGGSSAMDAAEARAALQAAGIPSRIEVREVEPEPVDPRPRTEYQVLVPGGLSLRASSVLDRDVFNAKMEADWKTLLESLSDDQLLHLNADAICEGFLDRAARLRKVYKSEILRRRLG